MDFPFPFSQFTEIPLQPDTVLWLISVRTVIMSKLTGPWEEGKDTAAAEVSQRRIKVTVPEDFWSKQKKALKVLVEQGCF